VCRRLACLLLLAVFWTRGAAAQTRVEWWPELDVYWQPSVRQRTFLELSRSTEHEGAKDEGTIGLYQDYFTFPNGGFLRGGARFTFSTQNASYREWRGVAEAVLAAGVPYDLQFANRARIELRRVNGEDSYRLRERVRLLRRTRGINGQPLWPYATFEAYYDSKYNTISRLAGRVGSELPFSKRRRLDVYIARQDNSRGSPARVIALGITLSLTF
jgi:hypothetical protein